MIEMEMTSHDCFMFKDGGCSGCIDMTICGPECPFKKTPEEQRAIEERITKRFKEIGFVGVYKSRIDGKVLYSNRGLKE